MPLYLIARCSVHTSSCQAGGWTLRGARLVSRPPRHHRSVATREGTIALGCGEGLASRTSLPGIKWRRNITRTRAEIAKDESAGARDESSDLTDELTTGDSAQVLGSSKNSLQSEVCTGKDDGRSYDNGLKPSEELTGLFLVGSSCLIFTAVSVEVKFVELPLSVQSEIRYLVQWAISFVYIAARRKLTFESCFGPPEARFYLLSRGFVYWLFVYAYWIALIDLPLGDATAVVYCSPIITALISYYILEEELRPNFFFKTLLAVGGIVFILKPQFLISFASAASYSPHSLDFVASSSVMEHTQIVGACAALLAAILGGVLPVMARYSRHQCDWVQVVHSSSALGSFVLGPLLLLSFWMNGDDRISQLAKGLSQDSFAVNEKTLILLVIAAVGGFIGLGCNTKGYQLAEASKACTLGYAEIPVSYVLQWKIFGEKIDGLGLVGTSLIAAMCVMTILETIEESKQEKRAA